MKRIILTTVLIFGLSLFSSVHAQSKKLISTNSVGPVKIGMSAARAQKLLRPLFVTKGVNVFEGDMYSEVKQGKRVVMTFIEYFRKITSIEVFDTSYQTAKGVHVGMLLNEVEEKYGKLIHLRYEGFDDAEYADFENLPKGIAITVAVKGEKGQVGTYPENRNKTTKFKDGIYVKSIIVMDH